MAGKRRANSADNHAYEATLASVMLDVAVQASDRTQQVISRALGYRNRSTLSHYQTGLYGIPVTSAERIAREVGLDEGAFMVAVLRQRHPETMREALVPPPISDEDVAAMRERLKIEGRAAALDMLDIVQRPLDGPALKAA